MTDVHLEREFGVSPETLFDFVTTPEGLAQWFGVESVTLQEAALDFTRPGPWFAVMIGRETGARFKVSGQVTHVDHPRSVGFTWAWHDPEDRRGAESHVTFTIEPLETGARLVLVHRDLPGDEAARNHREGWISTLIKLESLVN